jgi:hypothetical protein
MLDFSKHLISSFNFYWTFELLKWTVQRDFVTSIFSLNDVTWFQYTHLEAISNFVGFYEVLNIQNIKKINCHIVIDSRESIFEP